MAYEQRSTKDKSYWLNLKKESLLKYAKGETLTLEETAVAIWNPDIDDMPMTCMNVLKIEKKALAKLKAKLSELNINGLDDVFESKYQEFGRQVSGAYDMH